MTDQQASRFHLEGTVFSPLQFQDGELLPLDTEFVQDVAIEKSIGGSPNTSTSMLSLPDIDFVETHSASTPNNNSASKIGWPLDAFVQTSPNTAEALALDTELPAPVPQYDIVSPFSAFLNLDEPSDALCVPQSPSNRALWQANPTNVIKFYGTNPVIIIPWVQMVNAFLADYQKHKEILQTSFRQCVGANTTIPADEIIKETLLSHVDDVAIWAYEAAADFIRNRKKLRQLGHSDLPSANLYKDDQQTPHFHDKSIVINSKQSWPAGTLTSYCHTQDFATGGRIEIRFHHDPRREIDGEVGSPCSISILAIPNVRVRSEEAILVTFPAITHEIPMYTIIWTFNVASLDSEVLRVAASNDLQRFRNLLTNGEASLRDVSPQSWSLLCVSL